MSIFSDLKQQIISLMKSKSHLKLNLLRVVVGDIEMQATRLNKPISDELTYQIIKKVLASLKETVRLVQERNRSLPIGIEEEIEILQGLLPATWSVQQITDFLNNHQTVIKSQSEGQAMGTAMRLLKMEQAAVDANDVKKVIISFQSQG